MKKIKAIKPKSLYQQINDRFDWANGAIMTGCCNNIPSLSFPVSCDTNHKNITKKLRIVKRKLPKVDVYLIGHNDEVSGPFEGTIVDYNPFVSMKLEDPETLKNIQIQYKTP